MVVDKELFDLIKLSTHYSEITEGAFDITYASVGYLYNYPQHIRPTEEQIKAALPAVNWRNMKFDDAHHSVFFEHKGMRIDVGGIGKGYAVDRGIEILQKRGIQHAVVTAGGDSRIIGKRIAADGSERDWLVAIRHPDDPNKVVTRIPLSDAAMSTSGDYERYFDENGVRYHHIIDPRTGHSASKVRSATIIGPTATQTDGMSKTAFVLGAEKALEIINRMPEYDAVFVKPDGKVLYSNGLRPPAPRPQAHHPRPKPRKNKRQQRHAAMLSRSTSVLMPSEPRRASTAPPYSGTLPCANFSVGYRAKLSRATPAPSAAPPLPRAPRTRYLLRRATHAPPSAEHRPQPQQRPNPRAPSRDLR